MDQIIYNIVSDQDLFCIWGLATLAEPLKDDLIEKSLEHLIATIPALNCKARPGLIKGVWQFVKKQNVKGLIIRIKAETDEEADEHLKKVYENPIDSTKVSMIRLFSIDGPTKHYFVIQVHHIMVDGEGLKRICVQFAKIYTALYKDNNWKPRERMDTNRSWTQIAKYFRLRDFFRIIAAYFKNFYEMIIRTKWLKRGKYNLIGDSDHIETGSEFPDSPYYESIIIEEEVMQKFKAFAKNKGFTVNDILMTSLSLAIYNWNKNRGDDRDWLRFGYTANLRRWWGEPQGTFGNYSAIITFEEMTENLTSPKTALSSVKTRMDKEKKSLGLDIFVSLASIKYIPYFIIDLFSLWLRGQLYSFLRYNHAMTNIGIVFEEAGNFGHTQALGYSLLAPTGPGGTLIYTVTTYKNVTTIHVGCNETYFKKESAAGFLQLWKDTILEVIATD